MQRNLLSDLLRVAFGLLANLVEALVDLVPELGARVFQMVFQIN
jgi:hypothetical protein